MLHLYQENYTNFHGGWQLIYSNVSITLLVLFLLLFCCTVFDNVAE